MFTSDLLRLANVLSQFWRVGLDMLAPLFTGGALEAEVKIATADQQAAMALYGQTDLIGIYNQRLANRVGLHLALGGGFEPPPTP